MFATAIDIGDNMMDESKIRQIEMDLFQDRTEQAVPSALEMISEMDMDDDDEALAASGLLSKVLRTDVACDFVEKLAGIGFDFGVRFPDGETVTTMYASRGLSDPEVYRALVSAGADPTSCNRNGSNALHILASFEKSSFAKSRETEMAAIAGIPGNPSDWMVPNAYGATPLHLAVLFGHHELVTALLDLVEDVDAIGTEVRSGYGHAVDFNGKTPLGVASLIGDDESASLLLDHGADPGITDNSGRVASHFAVSPPPVSICRGWDSIPGMEAIVGRKRAILSRIGMLDATDDGGRTPLLLSLTLYRYQNGGLSEALLELGADPNIAANDGTTPLMAAVSNGHSSAVKALVSAGADMDATDAHGRTALHHAISWRDEKSARLLVKKGARFDIPDDTGKTAGEMAASAGMESVIELMV